MNEDHPKQDADSDSGAAATQVICQFACVPMRTSPDLVSEMSNQVLLGESARVLRQESHYLYVRLDHDAYEGWVDVRHFILATPEMTGSWEWVTCGSSGHVTCAPEICGPPERKLTVPIGTPLRHFQSGKGNQEIFQTLGRSYVLAGAAWRAHPLQIKELEQLADELLHTPYLWGGRTVWGIDCSGLAQLMHRLAGVSIGRDTRHQIQEGTPVEKFTDRQTGDLIFFESPRDGGLHVGVVWPQSQVFHASGCVRLDPLTQEGIRHAETGELTHYFREIRRCGMMGTCNEKPRSE